MPRGTHFYRCLDCGRQGTCGDAIKIYCDACAKKPKVCRKCGREEPQERFGFTSVCSECWGKEANNKCKDGCIYSRSMNQPYPRHCVKCGLAETMNTETTKPTEPENAIGSTAPTVEDRAHFTPEMQALAERGGGEMVWRDVKDGLPPIETRCLVWLVSENDAYVRMATADYEWTADGSRVPNGFNMSGGDWDAQFLPPDFSRRGMGYVESREYPLVKITHWMPLPIGPTEARLT